MGPWGFGVLGCGREERGWITTDLTLSRLGPFEPPPTVWSGATPRSNAMPLRAPRCPTAHDRRARWWGCGGGGSGAGGGAARPHGRSSTATATTGAGVSAARSGAGGCTCHPPSRDLHHTARLRATALAALRGKALRCYLAGACLRAQVPMPTLPLRYFSLSLQPLTMRYVYRAEHEARVGMVRRLILGIHDHDTRRTLPIRRHRRQPRP